MSTRISYCTYRISISASGEMIHLVPGWRGGREAEIRIGVPTVQSSTRPMERRILTSCAVDLVHRRQNAFEFRMPDLLRCKSRGIVCRALRQRSQSLVAHLLKDVVFR